MATSPNISNSFIRQFDKEVRHEFQRDGSLLRDTVYTVSNVVGRSHTFFQGNDTMAMTTKARNGRLTPQFASRVERECFLRDRYAHTPVDFLDEDKVNHDERAFNVSQQAKAAGRELDAQIIEAAEQTTTDPFAGAVQTSLSRQVCQAMTEQLDNNDVPQEGRCALVTPRAWNHLLSIKQFANTDYQEGHPYIKGYEARLWLGVKWMRFTGMTGRGTANATLLMYNMNSIGLAIGTEINTTILPNSERHGHDITTAMSTGSVLINPRGVVKTQFDDTAAIPVEAA